MATAIINSQMDAINESFSNISSDLTTIRPLLKNATIGAYPTDTASGSIANFTDGANDIPVKSLSVAIEPIQSGSGDPSPTNVRPISGHTEVNVYRTGKNLLNFLNSRTSNGITFTYDETTGAMSVSGTATANAYSDGSASISTANKYVYLPKGTYYVSLNGTLNANNFPRYYIQQVTKDGAATLALAGYSDASFELTADAYVYFRIQVGSGETVNTTLYPQIAKAQSDFEAPQSTIYPITLGQTVYGGTLDVVSGVLTVDRGAVDLGTLNWTSYNTAFYATLSSIAMGKTYPSISDIPAMFSDRYAPYNWQYGLGTAPNLPDNIIYGDAGNAHNLYIKATAYSTAAEFKTAMSGIYAYYPLATPTTVQLTATQVSTLLGENNVWSDAGTVEVVYRADTGLYIDKKLAQALNA